MRRKRRYWSSRRPPHPLSDARDRFLLLLMTVGGVMLLLMDYPQSMVSKDALASPQRFETKDLVLPGFLNRTNRTDLSRSISYLPQVTASSISAWGGRTPALDFKRNDINDERRIETEEYLRRREDLASAPMAEISPSNVKINSRFGFRRVGDGYRHHDGIDISMPHGAPIRAHAAGVVSFAGWRQGYGYTVIIDHGGGKETLYAHASALLCSLGRAVEKGDVVARVGNTGRSFGAHLHFEIRHTGAPVDPEDEYLAAVATPEQS